MSLIGPLTNRNKINLLAGFLISILVIHSFHPGAWGYVALYAGLAIAPKLFWMAFDWIRATLSASSRKSPRRSSMANYWPIRVGGIYKSKTHPEYITKRVTAIDGDQVFYELWVIGKENPFMISDSSSNVFRACALPEDQSPIAALLEIARFVIEHPHAAFGMGDAPHAQRTQMQEMAEKAIALAEGR